MKVWQTQRPHLAVRFIEHGTLDSFFDECAVTVYAPQPEEGGVPIVGWSDSEVFLACPVEFAVANDVAKAILREDLPDDTGVALDPVPATWRVVLVKGVDPLVRASILRQMREFGITVEVDMIANQLRIEMPDSESATLSALWKETDSDE